MANEDNIGFAPASNQGAALAAAISASSTRTPSSSQAGSGRSSNPSSATSRSARAVPLFLDPDGQIQEAGSAVDSNGAALSIGDGGDPSAFEHRFPATIDYGLPPALLVPTALFREVGRFRPGLHAGVLRGRPTSASSSTSAASPPSSTPDHAWSMFAAGRAGRRRLMRINQRTFADRWANRLRQRRPLSAEQGNARIDLAHRDAEALERIPVIDDGVPHHDRGSGDPRMAKIQPAGTLRPPCFIRSQCPGKAWNRNASTIFRSSSCVTSKP